MAKILALLSLFSYCQLFGQSNNTWIAFWNKDTTLIGFKDKNGAVKIEPKFQTGFTTANKFDNIIAVAEEINEHSEWYYLTKTGKIIGSDSLHIFDLTPDCESEGFIRFRDPRTDKVGMFNRNGDIVIPAEYNDLTRVKNGMITALKDSKKKYWEGGEHYSWVGGKKMLIDTTNTLLIDNFNSDNNINFFSLLVSKQPDLDTVRQNFKTIKGQYFSFINSDKEFKAWLKSSLLNNFTKDILFDATYKEVTFWKEPAGWTSETKNSFIERNYELIKSKLLQLNSKDYDYSISDEELNPLIFGSDEYAGFFNNCGESKNWIYPVKDITITYNEKKSHVQDHLEFLRTEYGYKLISLTIREGELK